jgi:hypothetical protein
MNNIGQIGKQILHMYTSREFGYANKTIAFREYTLKLMYISKSEVFFFTFIDYLTNLNLFLDSHLIFRTRFRTDKIPNYLNQRKF